jgi:transposase InsO family protein
MASTNPDEWKQNDGRLGDASEGIERLNQRWNGCDPSRLDAENRGRQTASLFVSVIIDVYSRRSIMVVSPTPRAETHKLALRLALLQWGVPELIVTDNGKDYISREFVGTLDSLNIQHFRTNPFSPWEKPFVERMNQTMLHSVWKHIAHSLAITSQSVVPSKPAPALQNDYSPKQMAVEIGMPAALLEERLNQWLTGIYEHDCARRSER